MRRQSMRFKPLLAVALVAALAAVACGDDGGASNGGVTAAVAAVDSAGLHAIDESITRDAKVPAAAHTTVVHLQTVMLVTAWPEDLQSQATKLAALLGEFAAAIDVDPPSDMKKATDASNRVHAASHDFSNQVWEYLGKQVRVAPVHGH